MYFLMEIPVVEIAVVIIFAISFGGGKSLGNLILGFIEKKKPGLIYRTDANPLAPDKQEMKSLRVYLVAPDADKTTRGVILNNVIKGACGLLVFGLCFLVGSVFFPNLS